MVMSKLAQQATLRSSVLFYCMDRLPSADEILDSRNCVICSQKIKSSGF